MSSRLSTSLAGAHAAVVGDLLMPHPAVPRLTQNQWRVKRLIDVAGSLFMLALTAPVMILAALMVGLSSSGPALVGEPRVGACGRVFRCYKFRTTLEGREAKITRVGRLLLATHIDELPQLFNVLAGEMSLIGPQPEWRHLTKLYRERFPAYELRFAAKPGITGLAQIDCPCPTEPEVKLHFDLQYIYNYSLSMDMKILLRAIRNVFWSKQSEEIKELPASAPDDEEERAHPSVALTQAPLT